VGDPRSGAPAALNPAVADVVHAGMARTASSLQHRLSSGELWTLLRCSALAWSGNRASSMGAALTYYTAFSLAPLLLIVVTIAGLLFGQNAARGQLAAQITDVVGPAAASAIQTALAKQTALGSGVFSLTIGIVALLMGATSVFVELQADLDRIWKSPPDSAGTIGSMLKSRLTAIGLIGALALLLMVSLITSAAIAAFSRWIAAWFAAAAPLLHVLNTAIDFGITAGLFAAIYKLLPRANVAWTDVWIGALLTSLLFSIGKLLIALYIGKSAVSSSYGAAGAFVALLVWLYYSAQLLLFGAEFTHQFAYLNGSLREPADAQSPPPAALSG
jgi:membrane protein